MLRILAIANYCLAGVNLIKGDFNSASVSLALGLSLDVTADVKALSDQTKKDK